MTRFEELGREVREISLELSEERRARQRARLVAAAGRKQPRRWVIRLVASVSLLGALALGFSMARVTEVNRMPPKGAAERSEASFSSASARPALDESPWELLPPQTERVIAARGVVRVAEASAARVSHSKARVRLELEHGGVLSEVTPGVGTEWSVKAGEYSVEAIGTVFSVRHDARREHFAVEVSEGIVRVHGGRVGASPVILRAGESLRVDGETVSIRRGAHTPERVEVEATDGAEDGVRPFTDRGTVGAKVRPMPSPSPPPARMPAPSRSESISATPERPRWLELHARGNHRDALTEVVARGFDAMLSSASCTELGELGDVARLAPDPVLAERALLSLRSRCSETALAHRAAFLLGRLVDSARPSEAARWYETYLSESSRGPFVEQALGRSILAHRRAGSEERARDAAHRYLASYPDGSYASVARATQK